MPDNCGLTSSFYHLLIRLHTPALQTLPILDGLSPFSCVFEPPFFSIHQMERVGVMPPADTGQLKADR